MQFYTDRHAGDLPAELMVAPLSYTSAVPRALAKHDSTAVLLMNNAGTCDDRDAIASCVRGAVTQQTISLSLSLCVCVCACVPCKCKIMTEAQLYKQR